MLSEPSVIILSSAMTEDVASTLSLRGTTDESSDQDFDIYEDDGNDGEVNASERSLIKSILGGSDRSINGFGGEGVARSFEKKEVSFSISPGSADSSVADIDKTRDELYTKLDKVEMKLKQAEIDLTAEKTMRKKKERNLIKLAKELNKRTTEQEKREEEISQLKAEVATYEAKLSATRKELDERISANEETSKRNISQLEEAQTKYREAVAAHDSKVSELTRFQGLEMESLRGDVKRADDEKNSLLSKISQHQSEMDRKLVDSCKTLQETKDELAAVQQKYRETVHAHDLRLAEQSRGHSEQTEELRRQLLAANLETDKFRTQFASLQMVDASSDEAARIVERAMRSSFPDPISENGNLVVGNMHIFLKYIGVGFIVLFAVGYQMHMVSMNSICSPVVPGKHLDKEMIFEAPWWAPASAKGKAFDIVCGSRLQTSMHWQSGRLTIYTKEGKVLLDRKAPLAIVYGDIIDFVDKKGKVETLKTPWAR